MNFLCKTQIFTACFYASLGIILASLYLADDSAAHRYSPCKPRSDSWGLSKSLILQALHGHMAML